MAENKTVVNEAAEADYRVSFMPAVHKIGRITMGVAFILSFLPVAYFYFVKGYRLPIEMYIGGITGVVSLGLGMWLSEPEAYWPVLGSAGTYIAYLSGNVGGMRFPVATTVQKNMNADITTSRGQVVTIVGIVASVVANLIILLAIVMAGQWIISILPQVVLSAFGFCVLAMLGAMLVMNFQQRGGFKAIVTGGPYMIVAVIAWYVCNKVFPDMFGWGMAIAVLGSIGVGYIVYRNDLKKAG